MMSFICQLKYVTQTEHKLHIDSNIRLKYHELHNVSPENLSVSSTIRKRS